MTRINCVGDICPVPVIKTKKAVAEMDVSQGLEIIVDNEIAVQNISKFLNSVGCEYSTDKDGGNFVITVTKYPSAFENPTTDSIFSGNDKKIAGQAPRVGARGTLHDGGGIIVAISSQHMGHGDEALGKLLMKGFIFAVSQLETLPAAIIFYNSGVYHVLKNSDSLKDLQSMEAHGVQILSCGTCLNHYNALDDLDVGEVTDMYNIVNMMQQAGRIICP